MTGLLLVGTAPACCWPPAAAAADLLPKDRILPLPPASPAAAPLSGAGCLPLQKLLNTRASSGLAAGAAGAAGAAASDAGRAGAATTGSAGRAAGGAAGCGAAAGALPDGSGSDAAATSTLLAGRGLLAARPLLTAPASGTGTVVALLGPGAATDGGAGGAAPAAVLPALGPAGPCGCVRAASSASSSAIWIRICEQHQGERHDV